MDFADSPVVSLRREALSDAQRAAIDALQKRVFSPEGVRVELGPRLIEGVALAGPAMRIIMPSGKVYEKPAVRDKRPQPNYQHFVVYEGDTPRAHAGFFDRKVLTPDGPRQIAALAAVCVETGLQGSGLGRRVVQAAFEAVAAGPYDLCLFQTGVPGFYEKLGCRRVENRFVNRATALDTEASPWWDSYVMIYPTGADWPSGTVDLNGEGF